MQALSRAKLKLFNSLKIKKYRYKHQLFVVEGIKMVREVLNSDLVIETIVFKEGLENRLELSLEGRDAFVTDEKSFGMMSDLQTQEGVLAIVQMPLNNTFETNILSGPAFILDGIQDPGNLGAIMRISDWFGMKYLICGNGTVDIYNPKSVRSSMGALLRVKVLVLDDLNEWVGQNADTVWIADLTGASLNEIDIKDRKYILIGNESKGVNSDIRQIEGIQNVKIPGIGGSESLNAAVAAGILAWEMVKQ